MRRIYFIILAGFMILGIGLSFSSSWAQGPSEVPKTEAPAKPVKIVTAIEVRGNKSISTNTILSKMKTRVGSPLKENVINDDLKRLYLLGFFGEGTRIDTEDYKEGVKVIVTVAERPIIDKINFTGIRRIALKDEKIKEKLKSKEKQYLDYPSLDEDVRTFQKMYEKIGFSDAKITYTVDVNKETNKANVQFNIVEGKKVRIKNIIIQGNKAFPARRILKLLKTKRGWLFNAGVLKEDVLKEDIERIKSFYHKAGYTDIAVDYEAKADVKRPYLLYITIKLQEGKKYLVGNVTLQGNKEISEKEILSRLKECTPGKIFSYEGSKDDVINIQGLYFDRGYISCQVQDTTSLDSYTSRVDINYNIVENEIAYVDKIKIKGNVKTKDVVVRRELKIHPGDKFDGDKLRRSKDRLQNLGFFEEISYDTEDTKVANKKDLVVDVKETKTGAFSFGGGYSTVDALVGFVEIEQKNFDWKNFPYFTGDGQDLRFRASFGTLTSGFDISFTDPWIFDYPISFGFDAYRREHKREEDVGYGYDEKVTGGDLRLGKEISEYLRADIMYRYDQITISDIASGASGDLMDEQGKKDVLSFTPGLTFDSRDNRFDTRKGDLLTGSLEWAGGPFGGDKDFWKFFGRASHYIPLPRNSVLELRARLGLADPYGDSVKIPIYERFFGGGANTVRGYEERMLGPVDPVTKDPLGGESLIVGNIEYTYPLFDFLKVAGFYDIGNVWQKLKDIGSSQNAFGVINTGGFKSSFGIGLRLKTPIGPINLDYGIPLDKEPGEERRKSGRFHFSASHGF